MNLKKSLAKVFSANLLQLLTSIIVGFFVPAILTIEGYASLRTYTFYISYVGFLHLGFVDGMYIKYGGKDYKNNNPSVLKGEHKIFLISQIIISMLICSFAVIFNNSLWFLVGVSVILINGYSFHRMYYQATGQFSKYTNYAYIYSLLYLGMNIILALLLKSQNPDLYCISTVISNLVVFIALEISFYKRYHTVHALVDKTIINNVKVGFFVLLGNLAITMFYAIDQWFVKFGMTDNDFAYYTFSVSLLNMVIILVNAIAITFYNYLAREKNIERIKSIKKKLLILGSFASCGYFVLAGIIQIFLDKYIPALDVISISFAAYPYMLVVNAIYVNLYKVDKNERKYFSSVIKMLIIACIYNTIALLLYRNIETIALATTLSFITWYFYSMKHFPYLKSDWKELTYLLVILIGFLICANCFNWLIGGLIYLSLFVLCVIIFGRDILRPLINRKGLK